MPMLGKAALLVVPFALIAPDVQASPECMTKQEARAKWPAKSIYLHGSSRCWDDQLVKNSADTDFFTGTSAITDTDLFTGAPITGWPLLIDIDDEAPNPNDGVDGCCWPSLDALRALITAVK
jgi:hypothetical protein